MSEHVITIDGDFTEIALMAFFSSKQHYKLEIKRIDGLFSFGFPDEFKDYWKERKEECQDIVDKIEALEQIFKGAESVTITHNVEEKANGN